MGGCDIYFSLDSKLSEKEVREAVRRQASNDEDENGHQDGYSGDWQTISTINFRGQVFETCGDAKEWCSNHTSKWEASVVKFKSFGEIKPSKTIEKINKKLQYLEEKFEADKEVLLKKIRSKPFFTCPLCKSKINSKYTNNECVVCNEYTPVRKKLGEKYEAKVKELETKKALEIERLRKKAKYTIKWLVYGVAAC